MLGCPQIRLADGVNLGLEGPGTWQMAPGILGFCGITSGKQLQTSCCSFFSLLSLSKAFISVARQYNNQGHSQLLISVT